MGSKRTNTISKRQRVKFIFPRFDTDSPRRTVVTYAKTGSIGSIPLEAKGKKEDNLLLQRSLLSMHRKYRRKLYSLGKPHNISVKTKRARAYYGGKSVRAMVLANGLPFDVKDGVAFLNIVPCSDLNNPEFKVVMINQNTYELKLIDYKGIGFEKMPKWNSNDIAKVASEATLKASSETLEIMESSYFVKDGKLLIKYHNGDQDKIIKEINSTSIKVPKKLTLNLK